MPVSVRDVLILVAIAAAGSAVAAVLFVETANTEFSLSKEAFRGTFTSVAASFVTFMTSQLRSVRGVGDAISINPVLPSVQSINTVVREYLPLYSSSFGGIGIIAGVPNNPTDIGDFVTFARARESRPSVREYVVGAADATDPTVFVLLDTYPATADTTPFIGIDLASDAGIRNALVGLEDTLSDPDGDYNATTAQALSVSGLFSFSNANNQYGMLAFSTIYPDAPTKYLVMAVTQFTDFETLVASLSPDATMIINDHLGGTLTLSDPPCDLGSADQVIVQQVTLTSGVTWSISIGQCPHFKDAYVSWRRWVLLSIMIVMTVLSLVVAVSVMLFQRTLVEQTLERARNLEKDRANQLVVGYICHELRNPLHVVKTSFRSLVSLSKRKLGTTGGGVGIRMTSTTMTGTGTASVPSLGHQPSSKGTSSNHDDNQDGNLRESGFSGNTGGDDDGDNLLTDEDFKSIITDGQAALEQMQTTVNEVLDFRAIDSGVSSLKLNPTPIELSPVVTAIAMRCRAFLPVGVGLKIVISDPKAVAYVDKVRLGQIITNGLSNAGKFTKAGDVIVMVSLVRKSSGRLMLQALRQQEKKPMSAWRSGLLHPTQRVWPAHRQSSPGSPAGDMEVEFETSDGPSDFRGSAGDAPGNGNGMPAVRREMYLCVTISNPRAGPIMLKPDDCFTPFKNKGSTGAWKAIHGSAKRIAAMRAMWLSSRDACRDATPVPIPELRMHRSGAVKTTTGLGLSLSRGFAYASGGWLALDESLGDGMTHLWCVLEATLPNTVGSQYPAAVQWTLSDGGALIQAAPSDGQAVQSVFGTGQTTTESKQGVSVERSPSSRPARSDPSSRYQVDSTAVTEPGVDLITLPGDAVDSSESMISSAVVRAQRPNNTAITTGTPVLRSQRSGEAMLLPSMPGQMLSTDESNRVFVTIGPAHPIARQGSGHSTVTTSSPLKTEGKLASGGPSNVPITAVTAASGPPPIGSLRIAFVDDDPANQRIGQRFMKALGVGKDNLILLSDGVEALAFMNGGGHVSGATSSLALEAPHTADVMFLDIRMPGKSGIEVMQEIGRSPPFPIIAMTGNVDKDSVEEYRSLGFSGCIGKPFERKALKRAMQLALDPSRPWFTLIGDEQ